MANTDTGKDAAQARTQARQQAQQAQAQAQADAREELARKILHYTRRYISSVAPIMLLPVYALKEKKIESQGPDATDSALLSFPLATDGVHLLYTPEKLIQDFREDPNQVVRQFLHVTLHCLLGHLPKREWDLAPLPVFDHLADYQVNSFIQHILNPLSIAPSNSSAYEQLFQGTTLMGACQNFVQHSKELLTKKQVKRLMRPTDDLTVDDHALWKPVELLQATPGGNDKQAGQKPTGANPDTDGNAGGPADANRPNWEEILREVMNQATQEGQSDQWGELAGFLQSEFDPAEDSGIRYSDFLKRFVHIRERMFTDPDSIDVRWYMTGLRLYGNVPLLEPLEIAEPPSPDDLVIALDTSGSCSGDICRRFLRETLNLLRDITAGLSSFHILLLQCDTEIQRELMLETPDQIDRLSYDFKPAGFGGTDFRPVFERVATLREQGTLPRVRGLLYLSDAFGDFPDTAPDYPTVFLIPDEGADAFSWLQDQIPDWVTTLHLSTHDFTIKEAGQS